MNAIPVQETSIATLLRDATRRLAGLESGRTDAEVLLAYLLDKPRSYLRTWPERGVAESVVGEFHALLARREGGEPVAYLTGRREFWSLDLRVGPGVLVPRPETETLVELALEKIPDRADCTVADLGTGSGAIALALAAERPRAHLVASDRSRAAVAVAIRNRDHLRAGNVDVLRADWCDAFRDACLDVIVSNPPYIAETDPHLLGDGVAHEPRDALLAGADGLSAYRRLLPGAFRCLRPGGWLLLEHGFEQQAAILGLLDRAGFRRARGIDDAGGQPRVSLACKPA